MRSRQNVEGGVESQKGAAGPQSRGAPAKAKEEFKLHNEEEAVVAIKSLREESSPNTWVVFGHTEASKDTLSVLGTGGGNVEELHKFFKDSDIVYALVSVMVIEEAGKDEYKTKKFVFISWVGSEVKPLVKARSSQIRLSLYNYLKKLVSVSAELQVLSLSEISHELILQKLAGTRVL